MPHSMARKLTRTLGVVCALSGVAATAGASTIPSYTVTDLGVGTVQLSAPTGADATLTAPDGRTVYAFPRTDNSVADSRALFREFPPFTNAPTYETMTYGDPRNAYSYFQGGAMLNRNGVFAAVDVVGVAGHSAGSGSAVVTAQRQADGSFGPLNFQYGTPNNYYSGGQVATINDLNNRDQLLGISTPFYFNYPGARTFVLADVKTGEVIDLSQLTPGWSSEWGSGMALDDQGRIAAYGSSASDGYRVHALLLTPAGVSSDPIATPEPSTLAALAVAAAGLAIRRRWIR